jgi:hypothetical protein
VTVQINSKFLAFSPSQNRLAGYKPSLGKNVSFPLFLLQKNEKTLWNSRWMKDWKSFFWEIFWNILPKRMNLSHQMPQELCFSCISSLTIFFWGCSHFYINICKVKNEYQPITTIKNRFLYKTVKRCVGTTKLQSPKEVYHSIYIYHKHFITRKTYRQWPKTPLPSIFTCTKKKFPSNSSDFCRHIAATTFFSCLHHLLQHGCNAISSVFTSCHRQIIISTVFY